MEPIANELIADYERNCQCASLSQSILYIFCSQTFVVSTILSNNKNMVAKRFYINFYINQCDKITLTLCI